ncbi:hypothetical protein IFT84_12935 [Rhizobium sp. CFBP 8762]|uniref:DUF2268 domain-containing putative Zn-dependent protease n=1 Tax=Rhizobium sp. CFBP 8762 TaxID=2775279 RepID=UPI0017841CB9|nr:DUF2268 domain-containing putative Zn-dependent protease [Rhizobium sp. CFBP 8762]MBD8555410.1 hypothetical protein [Rhizobium sp. CFBP 8762]
MPANAQDSVDVIVENVPGATIPEYGLTGSCFRSSLITLTVDSLNQNFPTSLTTGELSRILTHEVHHALRFKLCPNGYGFTLSEALVSEGLADCFVDEVWGKHPSPITNALPPAHWDETVALAGKHLSSDCYDHAEWFFGMGRLPRWAGYALGYRLVKQYLRQNPDVRPTGLAGVDASLVIDQSWPPTL